MKRRKTSLVNAVGVRDRLHPNPEGAGRRRSFLVVAAGPMMDPRSRFGKAFLSAQIPRYPKQMPLKKERVMSG